MPIIIPRNTDAAPVVTNPLTAQQKQELWENIVKNWCDKHPDRLRALVEPEPVKS